MNIRLLVEIRNKPKLFLLVLFDEIERLAEMPMANEAINAMLERIDLRIGLYFEDAMKGKRPVRKVA